MKQSLEDALQEKLAHDPQLEGSDLGQLCQKLIQKIQRLENRQERIIKISDSYQKRLKENYNKLSKEYLDLAKAKKTDKNSKDYIPICHCCKKVRDSSGNWIEVESFLSLHCQAPIGRGVCPDCLQDETATLKLSRPKLELGGQEEVKQLKERLLQEGILEDNPLLPAHLELLRRLNKTTRRLNKISKISDGFQSQLKALNQTLKRASLTDTLTGIANRRAMLERLKSEANRYSRAGTPFCVLMIDLDHFKNINDTYGHDAGDLAIIAVANTIAVNLRASDFCARWGGEEFLILLTQTQTSTAIAVADKLRQAVACLEVTYGDNRIAISFSGGVAQHQGSDNIKDTLCEADKALYLAKTSGRNKVLIAPMS